MVGATEDAAESNVSFVAETQPTTSATAPAALQAPSAPVHCPYRRTTDLLQRLAPNKMRVGFFIGAGCSLSIQGADGKPLIPDIAGLTKLVKGFLENDGKLKAVAQNAWARVAARGIPMPTIEDVLSHIRTLKSLCGKDGKSEIDGFSARALDALDLAICEHVRTIASKPLPTGDTPYHVLASWIQAIPRERPVEIFTTNVSTPLTPLPETSAGTVTARTEVTPRRSSGLD